MATIPFTIYIMISVDQLNDLVKRARESAPKRNFTQSAELTLVLRDIDVKKGFSVNEIVALPNPTKGGAALCVLGTGDMGLRARRAGVETVMDPETLDRIGTNKREARKIVRSHDFFVADVNLMSSVGRSLGPFLGPKGKMPTPVPYGAPIESIASRLRSSTRIRSKNQLNMSTKIGDETLTDDQIAQNASAVITAVEKRLPQGDKNVRNAIVKFTMGKAVEMNELKKSGRAAKAEQK
jgi:large subunit ribosomal protein L1